MKKRFRHPERPASKFGFTLIELLVAISLVSILSVTATQMFVLFMQLESSISVGAAGDLSRERLERQFRSDVHAAQDAQTTTRKGQQVLVLSHEGENRVEFVALATGIQRRELNAGKLQREDSWLLPAGQHDFEIRRPLVELHSEEAPGPGRAGSAPPAAWRFAAALGIAADSASKGEGQ
jgi:prepilin-type N-terminal cleavage/methylation domain-containing protein